MKISHLTTGLNEAFQIAYVNYTASIWKYHIENSI